MNAVDAAMLGDLAAVDRADDVRHDPDRLGLAHSASVFMTSRSSRMIASAASICAAKSGSQGVTLTQLGVSTMQSVSALPTRRRALRWQHPPPAHATGLLRKLDDRAKP